MRKYTRHERQAALDALILRVEQQLAELENATLLTTDVSSSTDYDDKAESEQLFNDIIEVGGY
jgi:hypothetical protein